MDPPFPGLQFFMGGIPTINFIWVYGMALLTLTMINAK